MTCHICGGDLERLVTDLPFKVAERRIVIIKGLPVLQCGSCNEYVIEDPVMERVDAILARVDGTVELEILSYVA
jgi:YgiT-type zinc finger domain-containing protein